MTTRESRRQNLDSGEPFTPANLLKLLAEKKVLSRKFKTPEKSALAELARILEVWRQHYMKESSFAPLRAEQERAIAAFRELNKAILDLRQRNQKWLETAARENASVSELDILSRRLTEIDATQAILEQEQGRSFLYDPSPLMEPGIGWKWLAKVLPEDFGNAMRSTNPVFDPGLGHNGPTARFVSAVAPRVTGETPTADSVATQLKRLRASTARGT